MCILVNLILAVVAINYVIPSWLLGRNFYRYGNDFLIFIIEASLDAWRHWTQANLGSQNSVVQALFIFTLDIESSHKFSRPKKRMMWPIKYMTKFMRTLFRKLMPLTMGSVNAMGSQGNTVYFLLSNVHTRKKLLDPRDLWLHFEKHLLYLPEFC